MKVFPRTAVLGLETQTLELIPTLVLRDRQQRFFVLLTQVNALRGQYFPVTGYRLDVQVTELAFAVARRIFPLTADGTVKQMFHCKLLFSTVGLTVHMIFIAFLRGILIPLASPLEKNFQEPNPAFRSWKRQQPLFALLTKKKLLFFTQILNIYWAKNDFLEWFFSPGNQPTNGARTRIMCHWF
ncbi:MAG TPA: hypothetical protein PL066_00340 [bacterium]|nr:hypothetical protein [bacterium]